MLIVERLLFIVPHAVLRRRHHGRRGRRVLLRFWPGRGSTRRRDISGHSLGDYAGNRIVKTPERSFLIGGALLDLMGFVRQP